MFVVRYMIVATALLAATVAWGLAMGLGAWQIIGCAALALLALQLAVLTLVVVLALRGAGGIAAEGRAAKGAALRRMETADRRRPATHLVILPK